MTTLICTVGLPRSGKSTWTKQMAETYGYPFVNLDSIRLALHGTIFDVNREIEVISIAKIMVKSLVYEGYKVIIIDETNLRRKYRLSWQSFMPNTKAIFKVFNIKKEECIKRAYLSNRKYLLPVIERMNKEYEPLASYEENYDLVGFKPSNDIFY